MSLTSHLDDKSSPIHAFVFDRFPNTRETLKAARDQLGAAEALRPAVEQGFPYSLSGMALDYRIRFYFAELSLADLAAYHGMRHARLGATSSELLPPAFGDPPAVVRQPAIIQPDIDDFTRSLQATLSTIHPIGRKLGRSDEELLARYCFVLALYETIYRSGRTPAQLQATIESNPSVTSSDELLALAEPSWIEDLTALSWAFYDANACLLLRPAILNPSFAGSSDVGGADADIILDDCLVEFKVTVDGKLKHLRDWLYQMIGYVLLDYSDGYGIRGLAIYLPRQRVWLRWRLATLLSALSGTVIEEAEFDEYLNQLRVDFRSAATKAR